MFSSPLSSNNFNCLIQYIEAITPKKRKIQETIFANHQLSNCISLRKLKGTNKMTYEEKAEQLLNSLPPEPEESNCECNEDYSWMEMELGEFKDGEYDPLEDLLK